MAVPLEHVYDEAALYANFLIGRIADAPTVDDVGRMGNDLAGLYRTLGLCELLIEGDPDAFFHHLIDSALTRRYFLQRCEREGRSDHPERRASVTGPLFDAVVAGQFGLTRLLDDLAPDAPMKGYEYEEDYHYARLIGCLVRDGVDERAEAAFARYEAAMEGLSDARLSVTRALVDRDALAFQLAFLDLLVQYEAEMDYERQVAYRFDDHHLIFLEGLALLRLAERRAMPTAPEYRYCPSLARRPDYAPFVPSSFPNLPLDV